MLTGSFHGEGGTFMLLQNIKSSGALADKPRTWCFFQVVACIAAALIVTGARCTRPTSARLASAARGRAARPLPRVSLMRAYVRGARRWPHACGDRDERHRGHRPVGVAV
jgi:hypothetical protein